MTRGIGYLTSWLVVLTLGWGCSSEAPAPASATGGGGATMGATGGATVGASGGTTYVCQPGQELCGSSCVLLDRDPMHCGACFNACPAGTTCGGGICNCQAGLTACGTVCADTQSDPTNCGGCGVACGVGEVCSLGQCGSTCAAGLTQCGSSCVDPLISPLHCGGCNNACPGGRVCTGGDCVCEFGTDCAGACVDTLTDPTNCGACGVACANGASCSAGVCVGGAGTGGVPGSGGAPGTGAAPSTGATAGTGGVPGTGATAATGATTGTGATPATGGTGGGTSEPPDGLTGVWVTIDDEGNQGCVPLCSEGVEPNDPDFPDWGYEGYSCIIPGSITAQANHECTTGEPFEEPDSRNDLPGIVVVTDDAGTIECIPVCTVATTSSDDSDWGWEYNATCILPDTWTARCNQTCTTGHPLPAPAARDGVIIDDVCVAFCACEQNPNSDPEYPDWSWEQNATCVMEGSESASGNPSCTTTEEGDLTPPPLTGTKVADGFYTQNGRLYDAYGAEFIIRGVNNPHIWFDNYNQYYAYQALDTIAGYGTNTIRVVWETSGSATLLAQILYRIVELEMVPMVELHDVTGSSSSNGPLQMAQYYTQADVAQVLQDYREYLLVNIANEWSGDDGIFVSSYQAAINELRGAGINHTLVIDANGYGQNAQVILNNHSALTSTDPESNLLFSVHMYGNFADAAAVESVLSQARSSSIPLIVGEFGWQLQGVNVAWQQILTSCQTHGIGYIAWSWYGNDDGQLDMANDWTGSLTSWGQDVMGHAAGISATSQRASIFQ